MLEKVYQELLELYEREHQILHGNFEGSVALCCHQRPMLFMESQIVSVGATFKPWNHDIIAYDTPYGSIELIVGA